MEVDREQLMRDGFLILRSTLRQACEIADPYNCLLPVQTTEGAHVCQLMVLL